jgi:hypothetical protein
LRINFLFLATFWLSIQILLLHCQVNHPNQETSFSLTLGGPLKNFDCFSAAEIYDAEGELSLPITLMMGYPQLLSVIYQ